MTGRRLHRHRLASGPFFIVEDIVCVGGTPQWTPVGMDEGFAVILLRAGGFRRNAEGRQSFVDAGGGYLSRHGVEERFAYPLREVDLCTLIGLTAEAFAEHVEGVGRQNDWHLCTSSSFDLRHRELVAACRRGVDRFEATERVLLLLSELPPRTDRDVTSVHRAATRAEHRRLVEAVREALSGGHLTADLDELARLAGSSPHHLSRVFRRLTGRTITAYRNELRVRAVLEGLAQGAADVTSLAATYGFADHAHLTRTVRRHVSEPPSVLRRKLSMNLQAS
jgi:AraC-like DNA-binding protein